MTSSARTRSSSRLKARTNGAEDSFTATVDSSDNPTDVANLGALPSDDAMPVIAKVKMPVPAITNDTSGVCPNNGGGTNSSSAPTSMAGNPSPGATSDASSTATPQGTGCVTGGNNTLKTTSNATSGDSAISIATAISTHHLGNGVTAGDTETNPRTDSPTTKGATTPTEVLESNVATATMLKHDDPDSLANESNLDAAAVGKCVDSTGKEVPASTAPASIVVDGPKMIVEPTIATAKAHGFPLSPAAMTEDAALAMTTPAAVEDVALAVEEGASTSAPNFASVGGADANPIHTPPSKCSPSGYYYSHYQYGSVLKL